MHGFPLPVIFDFNGMGWNNVGHLVAHLNDSLFLIEFVSAGVDRFD